MPTRLVDGEGRCPVGRNEQVHHRDRRGKDPGIWGKIRGVTLGRSLVQQGLTATCKDPLTKALTIGSGRTKEWRMSP